MISLFKFVGTFSLGLLTGISYSLTTITLPSLLTLPTAPLCARTLSTLRARSTAHYRLFGRVASASLALAFALSPSRARHPYLLWTALVAAAGCAGGVELALRHAHEDDDIRDMGAAREDEVNGEEVREAVERLRVVEGVRTGVLGIGLMMGIVGLWGDRFGSRRLRGC
ncbi:hypothetical protein BDY21DRAFT_372528 [Lineolata rhizophorae]|uniref:DUF4149 domain-containing protein n=1 Tax=Lineolata rhizophorae TaxID=578093 RepID=A0A6A6NY15_9PEZI|nr:hypothetical protein BDY21DRAFT_372528 [Lineolata rhizophorae]